MTEEELKAVRKIKDKLDSEEQVLNGLRESGLRIISAYSETPSSSGGNFSDSAVEKFTLRIIGAEKRIENLKVLLTDAMTELEEKINATVEDLRAREILILRYVYCLKFKDISQMLSYSEKHIRRLHKAAKEMVLAEEKLF